MRYSLPAHPYDWERELDPLARKGDENLLVRVASYKQLDDIGDLLDKAVKEKRPAFFLVKGRDGCGRSSAARFIMASYRDRRKIDPERFIIPSVGAGHSDEFVIIKRWMTDLDDEIDRRRIVVQKDLLAEFKSALIQVTPASLEATFLSLARKLGDELEVQQGGFAICLEGVIDASVISGVIDIFLKTQTVCVFTMGDYKNHGVVSEAFDDAVKPDQKLNKNLTLAPLRGADVRIVVKERWEKTTNVDIPFDLPGVERIFSDRERSVKRIMYLMDGFLRNGAVKSAGAQAWPDNRELGLQADELAAWLSTLERKIPL